ncbi:MAG: hypothetical protein LBK62_02890 [Treponema sp.]|jgi:hypothetical protein|nr:hypothetical protein [Treponema sp.]
MARKENVIAPEAQAMDLVAQKSNENLAIAKKLLDANTVLGEEYSTLSYIHATRNAFELHEKSGLVGGALLIAIREHEDHGSFLKALEQIGISKSKAYRYMHIAERYSKFPNLGNLNNSKLELLDEFSDSELEKLNDGEEVGGMTLDRWECLPATKVREECREFEAKVKKLEEARKHESDIRENVIAQKEAKINELDQQLRYQQPPTKEQLARAAVQRFRDPIIDNILEATKCMSLAAAAIDEAQKVPDVPYEALEELLNPWKESFDTFCDASADLTDAFNNIHVDKGRG